MSMTLSLDKWHTQLLLEALRVCDKHCRTAIENTDDDDVQSDYANGRMRLQILQEGIEDTAVKEFGVDVNEFSRESIPLTPTERVAS